MEEAFSFQKLRVYKESCSLVKDVYILLKKFPKEETYALCDQLKRAAVSVPSNIAEGMGRISDKEKAHFIEIAFGSLMETLCQIDIARELDYINEEEHKRITEKVHAVSRMLSGLHSSLNGNNVKR